MSGADPRLLDVQVSRTPERALVTRVAAWVARATPAETLLAERAHWFVWAPVVFGCGIGAYFALPFEPTLAAAVLPLIAGVIARMVGRAGLGMGLVTGCLIWAGAGFAVAKLRTTAVASPVLEKPLRSADVTGLIEMIEPRETRGQRLTLQVVSIAGLEASRTPRRVRIRTMTSSPGLKAGDVIRLTAKLTPPALPAVPGDYDFARQAWFQGLGAVGYSLDRPKRADAMAETVPAFRWRTRVEALRAAIGARVAAVLPGDTGAIATALITGERGAISQQATDSYRDSGLVHILSISGLHMAIMAGAVFAAMRLIFAAIPPLVLTIPAKKWAAVAGIVAAVAYLTISGGAAATVRSAIMIVIMFVAVLLGRPALALRNVALSALVILALYPESLLDAGFQMSFAAVVALVSAYEFMRERQGRNPVHHAWWWRGAVFLFGIVFSTMIAGLAVAPLSAYHFHKSQQLAVIANLFVIPVCNLVVMPAALATLTLMPFGLETAALVVMGWGIDVMGHVAVWVAAMPGAVGTTAAIPESSFAAMLAGSLWLVLWRKRWRLLGLPVLALGVALAPYHARPDVLVGRDGSLVAVRQATGALAAVAGRDGTYELRRWLEHDGDARAPGVVAKTQAFRCDRMGCMMEVRGKVVAVSRHPASLRDDCARAQILVTDRPRPSNCRGPEVVIDYPALRDGGTHAIYIAADGGLRIETVGQRRGRRPWTGERPTVLPAPADPAHAGTGTYMRAGHGAGAQNAPASDRLAQFAAPRAVADAFAPGEPMLDSDEDWP